MRPRSILKFTGYGNFPPSNGIGSASQADLAASMNTMFAGAIGIIMSISVYDAYLVYKYRDVIEEHNPICNWLISLEPQHVTFFLLGKGLCTLFVVLSLAGLFRFWRRGGVLVVAALLSFQVGLLGYLHTSEAPRKQFNGNWVSNEKHWFAEQNWKTTSDSQSVLPTLPLAEGRP